VALRQNGTVIAWGDDKSGQTSVPPGLTEVIAITAGPKHTLALTRAGKVVAWGDNSFGQTNVPDLPDQVSAIAAGWGHNLALLQDGTVTAWGDNLFGETTIPADLKKITAIAAGGACSLALNAEGKVRGWGIDGIARVANELAFVERIDAVWSNCLARRADGTIFAWGTGEHGENQLPKDLPPVVGIASGGRHNMAIVKPR